MTNNLLNAQKLTMTAVVCGVLSSTHAHAAPLYSCVYENASENSRFEVRIREESSDALFSYKFSPRGASTSVQGEMTVEKTDVTWSHFIFTGSDANGKVKLSVPAGLEDTSVYMNFDVTVNGQFFEPIEYLECKRAR